MSKIRYRSGIHFMDKGATKGGKAPVHSFSVDGGANREINLKSTDDMDIASEMEQARAYKNITIFLPPTEGIAVTILGEAFSNKWDMYIYFFISVYAGKIRTKQLLLECHDKAKIIKHPVKIGQSKETLLKVEISIPDATLKRVSYEGNTTMTMRW